MVHGGSNRNRICGATGPKASCKVGLCYVAETTGLCFSGSNKSDRLEVVLQVEHVDDNCATDSNGPHTFFGVGQKSLNNFLLVQFWLFSLFSSCLFFLT